MDLIMVNIENLKTFFDFFVKPKKRKRKFTDMHRHKISMGLRRHHLKKREDLIENDLQQQTTDKI